MAKIVQTAQIISLLEDFAPLNTSQHWDNSGWQINLGNQTVNKVMLALTVTEDVVEQAIKSGCNLIISHHPLFFDFVKRIEDKIVIEAIKNNIQIYSAHTNLDIAKGGTSDTLAKMAGFNKVDAYNDFVRYKSLSKEIDLDDFIVQFKKDLKIDSLKLVNNKNVKAVKTIGFCAGAGGSFISELKNSKIDLYITGDIRYHESIDAESLVVLDIGHFESEKCVTDIFKNILKKSDVEIIVANEENTWQIK